MVKNSKCWIGKFNRFSYSYSNGNSCFCFLNEKMKANGWIGGVISFIGIAFISFSQGVLFNLIAGIIYIISSRFRKPIFRFQTAYLKSTASCHLPYIQFYLVRYVCLFSYRECIKKYWWLLLK